MEPNLEKTEEMPMISEKEKQRRKATKWRRNQKIIKLYESEKYTIREISERPDIDVTPQRIGQILKRAGVDGKLVEKARQRKNRVEKVCEGCGIRFWVRPSKSEQKYHNDECFRKNANPVQYPEEDLIAHLRMLKHKHGKITVAIIRKESPPSYTTLKKRIGGVDEMRKITQEKTNGSS